MVGVGFGGRYFWEFGCQGVGGTADSEKYCFLDVYDVRQGNGERENGEE